MISKSNFLCQFSAFDQAELQWSTCGVTALAMVLQQLTNKEISTDGNLESFLAHLISAHKNAGEVVKKSFSLNTVPTLITLRTGNDTGQDEVVENEPGPFNPIFTISNGIDHRGIPQIAAEFEVKAETKLHYSFDQLVQDFLDGKFTYFLASIHSLLTRGKHIVIIQDIGEDETGKYIEFIDPAELDFEKAVKRQDFDFFKFIYNSHGTAIFK